MKKKVCLLLSLLALLLVVSCAPAVDPPVPSTEDGPGNPAAVAPTLPPTLAAAPERPTSTPPAPSLPDPDTVDQGVVVPAAGETFGLPTPIPPTATTVGSPPSPTPEALLDPDKSLLDPSLVERLATHPVPVQIIAAGNETLEGTYYPPIEAGSAAILFLHMIGGDRHVWQNLALTTQQDGYAALAVDLRGHGASGGQRTDYLDPAGDGQAASGDITAALDWLAAQEGINRDRLVVIAASGSGNLALQTAAEHAGVQAVALLSPLVADDGFNLQESLTGYGPRPLLLAAAEEDPLSLGTTFRLPQNSAAESQVLLYPGNAHGTNLLLTQGTLSKELLAWLERLEE